jgi:hypothetical protein
MILIRYQGNLFILNARHFKEWNAHFQNGPLNSGNSGSGHDIFLNTLQTAKENVLQVGSR